MTRAPVPVHESFEATFAAAIPPRPAPLLRRMSWRVLLALLAFAPSRALLLAFLRRR